MRSKLQHFLLNTLMIMLVLASCSPKRDPSTGKIIRQETNVNKKAENAGGVLFGKGNKNTNYEFATSNVLWRASIGSLEFLPLLNASYSGGIIITDWYSGEKNSNEMIKINVRFLSNELASSSIVVSVFKKTCDSSGLNCKVLKNNNELSKKIKNQILSKARELKIKDELTKK